MTKATATIRAFVPDDWAALCALYDPAARYELALSGTDPRAFRPLAEEEDLDEFQRLNTAMVALHTRQGRGVRHVARPR